MPQAHSVVELREFPIERTEWQMSCLSGDFQHEAVRKAERRSLLESLDSCSDDVRVLYAEVAVVEKHVDGRHDLLRFALIYCVEHP